MPETEVTTHAPIVIVNVVDTEVTPVYVGSDVVMVTVNGLPVLSVAEVLKRVSWLSLAPEPLVSQAPLPVSVYVRAPQ